MWTTCCSGRGWPTTSVSGLERSQTHTRHQLHDHREDAGRQRSPRNPIIVEVLRDYGYVDARGMGVRNKIVPLVREASGAEPGFEARTEDHLRVVLPKG